MSPTQHQSPVASSAEKERFGPTQPVVHNFLANTPLMQVVEVVRLRKEQKEKKIVGIRCCWFCSECKYHEAIFSTNNLRHARPEELPAGYKPRTEKQSAQCASQ